MTSYQQAFYGLKNELQQIYDAQEAAAIAHEVLYHISGLDKMQRLMRKEEEMPAIQEAQLQSMQASLLTGKPMQYVLETGWFMGRAFYVNENVLIPRPETEELVQWIIDDAAKNTFLQVLDIGTGTGCIPVSLKLAIPQAKITGCDISAGALAVAQKNAVAVEADVDFLQLDFLSSERNALAAYDIIVSNPPYIPDSWRAGMHSNVKDHEPALALFVPDKDPLLFYKAIADFGHHHLRNNGTIYCELHADHATETKDMFIAAGYSRTELRKDMHGNLRMLKALP